jgi:hypothetical protein
MSFNSFLVELQIFFYFETENFQVYRHQKMIAALYDNYVNKANMAINYMNNMQYLLDMDNLSVKSQCELACRLHFIRSTYFRIKGMPRPTGSTAVLQEPEWDISDALPCGR